MVLGLMIFFFWDKPIIQLTYFNFGPRDVVFESELPQNTHGLCELFVWHLWAFVWPGLEPTTARSSGRLLVLYQSGVPNWEISL